ncbi:MAG TPA: hypothetical protein VFK12_07790 [Gammaproteobacteria bacterium]|nr:hypothetical protein [Gammaproteobacteria bacterium]
MKFDRDRYQICVVCVNQWRQYRHPRHTECMACQNTVLTEIILGTDRVTILMCGESCLHHQHHHGQRHEQATPSHIAQSVPVAVQ